MARRRAAWLGVAPPRMITNDALRARLAACVLLYAVLVGWTLWWPYTGDGDSALHYLSLRQIRWDVAQALTAWARPAFVALFALPALFGVFPARAAAALLTVVLVWQTARMADDLRLPNATLAGFFLIAQPLVFALGSDTMTELPTALAVAVAIRLWWAGRWAPACVVVSFVPLFRPEGFFLVPLWAAMVLATTAIGSLATRLRVAAALGVGAVAWMVACTMVARNPIFFVTSWPWSAAVNAAKFQAQPLWSQLVTWPYYCGHALVFLFVLGVPFALRPAMALPWLWWTLVIGIHSVLTWLNRFEAYGLMRIHAASAPTTALVCLYGWNAAARAAERLSLPSALRRTTAGVALAAIATVPLYYYWAHAEHHHGFPIRTLGDRVRATRLLDGAPRLFVGDYLALVDLGLGWNLNDRLLRNVSARDPELARLTSLPAGSVGYWDNQQAEQWFGVTIDDLVARGFTVLAEVTQRVPYRPNTLPWRRPWFVTQRYVLLRKDVP
jgi:hypothetical protein